MKTRAEIARYLSDRMDNLAARSTTVELLYRLNELALVFEHCIEPCVEPYRATEERHEIVRKLEEEEKSTFRRSYDPLFGDEKLCACGHTYYRHFDTFDDMFPIGCKYCECLEFKEEGL